MLTKHHQLIIVTIALLLIFLALALAMMPGAAHGFIF
jgi:hypothetical protein